MMAKPIAAVILCVHGALHRLSRFCFHNNLRAKNDGRAKAGIDVFVLKVSFKIAKAGSPVQ